MATPRVLILRAPGSTGDQHIAAALETVGAETATMTMAAYAAQAHDGIVPLTDFQGLLLPDGLSYGDAFAPGRVWAWELNQIVRPGIERFVARSGIVLGIGNGFQAMIQAGWLPEFRWSDAGQRDITIQANASGRFESRLFRCQVPDNTVCPLFEPGQILELPLTSGWARIVERSVGIIRKFQEAGLVILRYAETGSAEDSDNPAGMAGAAAGFSDQTGRIVGMALTPGSTVQNASSIDHSLFFFRQFVKRLVFGH